MRRFCFEKLSTDTGVTDINIGINGWVLFSVLHIKVQEGSETTVIIFNRRIYENTKYK